MQRLSFSGNRKITPTDSTDQPMIEARGAAAQRLEAKKSARRRTYRLFCFFMIAGVFALTWVLAVLPFVHVEVTKTFDSGGFEIELDGCDLDFVAGSAHKVTYSAMIAAYKVSWSNSQSDANTLVGGVFSNSMGCVHS